MIDSDARRTNRFYRHSYILLPIPIAASAVFAFYVVYTGDKNIDAYCAIAKQESAYSQSKLDDSAFVSREKVTLNICKTKDKELDQADGRDEGIVRWFTCRGTTCGPGWETFLAEK